MAAERAVRGRVNGIDRSDVMVKQASRRNQAAVAAGRVELEQGTVSRLPFEDGTFSKVFEVNTFHHWPSPKGDLEEILRVMKPGGLLLLCLRMKPRRKFLAPPGYTKDQIEAVKDLLRRVGFRQVCSRCRDLGGESATCVVATK
jgi:ubiquinone/menaquinone biosynthesis C-methylase UbiE